MLNISTIGKLYNSAICPSCDIKMVWHPSVRFWVCNGCGGYYKFYIYEGVTDGEKKEGGKKNIRETNY